MEINLESLAALATILGTVLSLLALIQSRNWLIFLSLPFIGLAILSGLYARRDRLALRAAAMTIEGHSIDALNIANLRRRVNRTLVVQEANHVAHIDGEDLKIEWTYSGYCRAKSETAMTFSIESEHPIAYERLHCVAYDLENDRAAVHPIRPILIGTDGLSKKLSVPFLEPLTSKKRFSIRLKCILPRAMKVGFGYYSSTLSFAQNRVGCCTVQLIFTGTPPNWMRVYEASPSRQPALVKSLVPVRRAGVCEYLDRVDNAPGQSARVYAFWRDSV